MADKKDGYCLGCETGVDADDAHICEDGKYHPECDLSPAKSERRRAATNIQRTIRGKLLRKRLKKPTKRAEKGTGRRRRSRRSSRRRRSRRSRRPIRQRRPRRATRQRKSSKQRRPRRPRRLTRQRRS